ncbi:MAG: ABC transporter permease subunit [Chloroflexi bacterium]|nr:ABC transporter permease subunit [Chloroflexota bacterium]
MGFSLDFSQSAGHSPREATRGRVLAIPAVLWLLFFFLFPLVIVLLVSFMTRGPNGTIVLPLTLEHYQRIFGPIYFPVFLSSIWTALLTTIICLLAGYPLAFFISTRKSKRAQNFALFLVILPFWTNFLVRTYAWRMLLGTEGTINETLMNLHIITQPLQLLNTRFAVLVGLVYGELPFMILPIYTSVERFDFRLVEAAHDLGGNDWKAFWRVVFPLTLPGVLAGCILVFIPSIGAFITPDLLGGTQGLMIGNLINQQFHGTGNWPLGSAASVVMMGLVMIGLLVYTRLGNRS